MVRHPLDRLLSAYRDKKQPEYFKKRIKTCWPFNSFGLRDLMKNVTNSLHEMDRFGFHFFILDNLSRNNFSWENAGISQRHWSKSTFLCRLCSIDYDFIAKLESIEYDSRYIISKAGHEIEKKIFLGLHTSDNNQYRVVSYFKGLSRRVFLKLYKIYESDFEILGYGVSDLLWESLTE